MAKISSCACWIAGRFRRDHQLVSHPLRIPFEATTCGAAIVDGLRATHRSARFPLVVGTLVALSVFGCNEFPAAPEQVARISVSADSPWPSPFVQDIDTIAIDVRDALGVEIQGLEVDWASSDPTILEVTELHPQPPDSSFETVLTDQLRAVIEAHRRGTVEISIVVRQPGFRRDSIVVDSITVQEHWIQVSAGAEHTCAITIDGALYCWGSGLIGNGDQAGSSTPTLVDPRESYTSVTVGSGHACGIVEGGRARCWGRNEFGAIGNGDPGDQLTPVDVSNGLTFRSVVAGAAFVCGVSNATTQAAYCWGDDIDYQLGDAGLFLGNPYPQDFDTCVYQHYPCSLRPRPVQDRDFNRDTMLAVAPGDYHTCAISSRGTAICWGTGTAVLGRLIQLQTDPQNSTVPDHVELVASSPFESVTSGDKHTCALSPEGQAFCWGLNDLGQLGTGTGLSESCQDEGDRECSTMPLLVSTSRQFLKLEAGGNTTCGITRDSTSIYCWGSNENGEVGTLGPLGNCASGVECQPTPLQVALPESSRIVSISVGDHHACAVTERGAAYCWGQVGKKLGRPGLTGARAAPDRVAEPS